MKSSATSLIAALGMFLLTFAMPLKALADTYQLYELASDQEDGFYGMDDSGNAVFTNHNPQQGGTNCQLTTCYFTYDDGLIIGNTYTPPTLAYDDGTPCTPNLPAGVRLVHGVCNDGRIAFTGYLTPDQRYPHVYAGANTTILVGGLNTTAATIYMDSLGDIVFDDEESGSGGDHFYEAIDQNTSPVPEPSSFVLLGTGSIAVVGAFRRLIAGRRW